MAAINPEGGNKYWFQGLPFSGVESSVDASGLKYWFSGLPYADLFPATAAGTATLIFLNAQNTLDGNCNLMTE